MENNFRKGLILAGGCFPPKDFVSSQYEDGCIVVVADRGAMLAREAALPIDCLLGDFDSLPSQEFEGLKGKARQVLTYPEDKDYSDLELALQFCATEGCKSVKILAALGGDRLEHTVFNVISILEAADELGVKAEICDPGLCIFQMCQEQKILKGHKGKFISIVALDREVTFTAVGTKWHLDHAILKRSSTRGLSNLITSPEVKLTSHAGRALIILNGRFA